MIQHCINNVRTTHLTVRLSSYNNDDNNINADDNKNIMIMMLMIKKKSY